MKHNKGAQCTGDFFDYDPSGSLHKGMRKWLLKEPWGLEDPQGTIVGYIIPCLNYKACNEVMYVELEYLRSLMKKADKQNEKNSQI